MQTLQKTLILQSAVTSAAGAALSFLLEESKLHVGLVYYQDVGL